MPLADEVVVQQQVGGDEGVEDPDQGDGEGGDDVAILDHLVQTKSCSVRNISGQLPGVL